MVLCGCGFEVCEFEEITYFFHLIKETVEVAALLAKARGKELCLEFYRKVAIGPTFNIIIDFLAEKYEPPPCLFG
jgi:hypothetical protein